MLLICDPPATPQGFFRRSIQQKIQYRPCTKNQQCSILRINRNRCQYCRLKKCIAVGMSRDAVRFGRVPKREKAKILAAMQKVNACSQERALTVELEDETKLMNCIIRAHGETCDYTKDKVIPLLERARTQPVYTQCSSQLACPLNPPPRQEENGNTRIVEDFSERFWPAIRGVVEFAKRIPGFSLLAQDDQVTLLKAGVFEVLLVRLACMFDHQSNAMICLNGQLLRREAIHSASNARFLLDSMFDFSERLNALQLSDNELGLFCAVVIITADRPGIRNTELVQKIQKKLMDVLQKFMAVGHLENPGLFGELMKKIPDLRTLNTLHSEKLLAYKMEPRNQQQASAESNSVAYSALMPDHWAHYTYMMTGGAPRSEEDRGASPISQHSGSTTGSEWSTTDSKDGGPERFGSPRSVGSCLSVEEAKSPIRTSSFSSTRSYDEGVCPMEMGSHPGALHEFVNLMKRPMPDHSSGDESFAVDSPAKVGYSKIRRVDSPTDSGIESGKEHGHSVTPTTSVCSSPHSSLEEKVKDVSDTEQDKHHSHSTVDDMPVLKRALQAPPLINTTMLMDEAYRHHKKFRATRKDSDSPSSPSSGSYTRTPPPSLASSHSTLLKTLEQPSRYMSEQQMKQTDMIHSMIMRTESVHNHHHPASEGVPAGNFVYSVPQNHHQSTVTSKSGSGVVVCPPGYYIPAYNPAAATPPWPFMGTGTVAVASQPVLQMRTPFVQGTTPMCPRRSALEARLTASPSANCPSPLVIPTPSPNRLTPDHHLQVNPTDAQPLNLSKKMPCAQQPTVLKMQS